MVDISQEDLSNGTDRPLEIRSSPATAVPAGPTRRVLLLGGPFGPFFSKLAAALEQRGADIFRVNLHAADVLNWGLRRSCCYNFPAEQWPRWIARYMTEHGITDIIVYGDCQYYNRTALDEARKLGAACHVFEQGYFRPDWITYEKDGVNGFSGLARDPAAIHSQAAAIDPSCPVHEKVGAIMPYHVAHVFLDYIADALGRPAFFRYRWPYLNGPAPQAFGTLTRVLRRQFQRPQQRQAIEALRREGVPYYLCLLQREGDSQILFHSAFGSVAGFYEAVMQDFLRHAPAPMLLVFKNHPLDPGLQNHGRRIAKMARVLGIGDRVQFLDGGNLTDLARPARGVITINSTGGISTIQFGVPTIALGHCIYNLPGLTHQGSLADFWGSPERPDLKLFHAFHRLVLARTQINGNFYSPRGRRMMLQACADRVMAAEDQSFAVAQRAASA